MPVIACWLAMNLGGHVRRSIGTAWQIGFGNSALTISSPSSDFNPMCMNHHTDPGTEISAFSLLVGGIIATYSFLAQDAPNYYNGYIICISFSCLSGVACIVYFLGVWYENRQRDRNAAVSNPEAVISGHLAEEEECGTENLGDLAPDYRYSY